MFLTPFSLWVKRFLAETDLQQACREQREEVYGRYRVSNTKGNRLRHKAWEHCLGFSVRKM